MVTEKDFADPDSKFIEVNDVTVHYKEMGAGETTFILLHGFGASVYSWREVMDDFAQRGRVIAYDRPAFGLTERPMPEDWVENPYGMKANIELLRGLMDALNIEKAVLVGNSAGGGVAGGVWLGISRTEWNSLILVDPGVGGGRGPQFPSVGVAADVDSANAAPRSTDDARLSGIPAADHSNANGSTRQNSQTRSSRSR